MKPRVIFILLAAGTVLSSGCVTNMASNYGVKYGAFNATGPVHGDASQIYVRGKLDIYPGRFPPQSHWLRSPEMMTADLKHWQPEERGIPWRPRTAEPSPVESRPAYMLIKFGDGQIASQTIHECDMPPVVFEYPKITLSPRPENGRYKDVFTESGRDAGTTGLWYLYVKNPHDADEPVLVWLTGQGTQYPRTGFAKIIYPLLYTGAVVADVVLIPVYVVSTLGVVLVVLVVGVA